jgi:hypothetical protein
MKIKKAQSAAEFMIIIGAVMLFFISFMGIIQKNISLKADEERGFKTLEIALAAQNELDIAAAAIDGYRREFTLPANIVNLEYNITLINNDTIYIFTSNGRHALSLPGQNTTGNFNQTGNFNVIRKENSIIYLNSDPP